MFLLDTHTLVWSISDPRRLPKAARKAAGSGKVKVSVISLWEMILKKTRKNAPTTDPMAWWDRHVSKAELEVLAVRVAHLKELDKMPEIHGDPFDRMLVAQALAENCTLVSRDEHLAHYGVPVVWE